MATLSSMTGFARAEGQWGSDRFVWEVRSVNARGLDVRCRLPAGMESLEADVRALISAHVTRGSVNASLTMATDASKQSVALNRAALDELMAAATAAAEEYGISPPKLDALLAVRGVVEVGEPSLSEEDRAARSKAILAGFKSAMGSLVAARRQEGGHLAALLSEHIDRLETLIKAARTSAASQPEALRARLEKQIADILAASKGLDDTRLTQEVALLATKADIREELDRLVAHIAAARALLTEGGVVGRKFDFLTQEFGREANTLCSKAAEIELTRIGLDMKSVIDQIREQVQNVE
jgi:uncharacterized protein (TIGR00255 family)